MNGFGRFLLVALLLLSLGGFGICSGLGVVIMLQGLTASGSGQWNAMGLVVGLTALGALAAWLSWRGLRAVLRQDAPTPTSDPGAPREP